MGNANGGPTHQRANRARVGEQAARAYELRLTGMTLAAIAKEMGLSVGTVHARIEAHLAGHVDPLADEYRRVELDRLDDLQRRAYEVLDAKHLVAQNGKVVEHEGAPLRDHAPVLAAIDRLVRISERRAKLLGLDMPAKVSATVTQADPKDLKLSRIIEEAKARNAAEEAALRGLPDGSDQ